MSYDKDPVVEEIRKVREQIMKEYDYDLRAFGRFLAQREQKHRRKPVKISSIRDVAVVH